MNILAIESSCDETAAAVIEENDGSLKLKSNIIASQIEIHTQYGGVVPEVAARAHIENIVPVIEKALECAKLELKQIDRIAVTQGPGLIGSLLVGVETAKALAVATGKPLFPINHLEGHLYASFLGPQTPSFPLLGLLVSGGNSLLILMDGHSRYQIVGQTRDDAAGEAFDKGAKLLGLGYPGGPLISKLAEKGQPEKYSFPRIDLTEPPQRDTEGFLEKPVESLDFSFSGLKTALLNKVKTEIKLTAPVQADLSAGFEKAIVDTLEQNTVRAIERYRPQTFILAGGVAANQKLRHQLDDTMKLRFPNVLFLIPEFSLCGDNAAMIGAAAAFRSDRAATLSFSADPSLKL